jgi:hypothetical protein
VDCLKHFPGCILKQQCLVLLVHEFVSKYKCKYAMKVLIKLSYPVLGFNQYGGWLLNISKGCHMLRVKRIYVSHMSIDLSDFVYGCYDMHFLE